MTNESPNNVPKRTLRTAWDKKGQKRNTEGGTLFPEDQDAWISRGSAEKQEIPKMHPWRTEERFDLQNFRTSLFLSFRQLQLKPQCTTTCSITGCRLLDDTTAILCVPLPWQIIKTNTKNWTCQYHRKSWIEPSNVGFFAIDRLFDCLKAVIIGNPVNYALWKQNSQTITCLHIIYVF